jgi:hypothetical protein
LLGEQGLDFLGLSVNLLLVEETIHEEQTDNQQENKNDV